MTKEETLSILYSERTRLQEKYNISGWSFGAIVAAISALVLQIINTAYENCVNWDLSFMICFALFDIVLCVVFTYQLIIRKIPVFIRYSNTLRFYSILFVLYFLFHIVSLVALFFGLLLFHFELFLDYLLLHSLLSLYLVDLLFHYYEIV